MRFLVLLVALLALLAASPAHAVVIGNPVAAEQSAATESSHVFSTVPANLYSAQVAIGSSAGYALAFNATTAPADGAVTPVLCVYMPANTTAQLNPPNPIAFSTGITFAFSTTGCFTKTASATAFFSAQVR